jgi:glycosyltransferase involved in cell wall biosynthesis
LGGNAIRLYHVPPSSVLDAAGQAGLRLLIDVPWQKHRCFFEDWQAQKEAREQVTSAARLADRHPVCFALSVANEIPHDVVRFYGAKRVERFLDDLLCAAKDIASDCLVTYCNYPSSEFLSPRHLDFYCANVYLNDPAALGRYLDRLHHVAGPLPVVLGEHGSDALAHGEEHQAADLREQVRAVFRRGLAGSFVFSYTDDWHTGGSAIDGWGFGVTRRDRQEKRAATALADAWLHDDGGRGNDKLDRVSVVVCSYNGGTTLGECLQSLVSLDYPDYEVILVDDGSTDDTPDIAARFPDVRTIRQPNRGLSAARNAGLQAATGRVVAYTDSDCVADRAWLSNLMLAMNDQQVDAIGGPNVPPPSDGMVAMCVAASPGGPSHVMIDDRLAEHVPGCNMAFDRARLLALGGFDEQFRQAGDDVDICWRFLDAGHSIGYAPGALVWHHRRATVRGYIKQQAGYGRSEAMVLFKHPRRAATLGGTRWGGVIYGDGAVGLPVAPDTIYHGRFGTGTYQIAYRSRHYTPWVYATLLEWHATAAILALFGAAWWPAWIVVAAMMLCSFVAAARAAASAPLPHDAAWWCRPLVFALNLLQPVVRSWHRHRYRLTALSTVRCQARTERPIERAADRRYVRRVSFGVFDRYWSSDVGRGREHLLDALSSIARRSGWHGDYDAEWAAHDVEFWPGIWHAARLRTATEELGGGRRFTRARITLHLTLATRSTAAVGVLAMAAWPTTASVWAATPGVAILLLLLARLLSDRRNVRLACCGLLERAGRSAKLVRVQRDHLAASGATS